MTAKKTKKTKKTSAKTLTKAETDRRRIALLTEELKDVESQLANTRDLLTQARREKADLADDLTSASHDLEHHRQTVRSLHLCLNILTDDLRHRQLEKIKAMSPPIWDRGDSLAVAE